MTKYMNISQPPLKDQKSLCYINQLKSNHSRKDVAKKISRLKNKYYLPGPGEYDPEERPTSPCCRYSQPPNFSFNTANDKCVDPEKMKLGG